MNQVNLIGRLTDAPKINDKCTAASFTLAVQRNYKPKSGEPSADFINCKMLGEKKADVANKYLHKGMKIAINGSIQTGSYEGRNGKVYTTDVIVNTTEFCESKNTNTASEPAEEPYQGELPPMPSSDGFMNIPDNIPDGELPFR